MSIPQTLIVRTDRMKLLRTLLLLFVGFASVVWVLASRAKAVDQGLSDWLAPIATFVVMAWVIHWTIRELFDRRPRVVIDDHGVVDRLLGVGLIPWSDIVSADSAPILGYSLTGKRSKLFGLMKIVLELRDPGPWREKFTKARPLMGMLNRATRSWEFNLNLAWTDVAVEEVLTAITGRIENRSPPHH